MVFNAWSPGRRPASSRLSVAVLMLVLGVGGSPSAQSQAIDQVARIALERHPRVAELREAVQAAEAEVEIPEANRNVQLSLEAGVGRQHTQVVGSSSIITPTLRLRKLIHDAGRTDQEVMLREARLRGARATLMAGHEDLALEVVTAYIQAVRAMETLDAAQKWLEGLKVISSMTNEIQQIDRGRQFDNALAVSRVQRAEAEILARKASLADALTQLRGLTSVPVEPVPIRTVFMDPPANDFDRMSPRHPRMQIAQATIDVARAQSTIDQLYDRPRVLVETFAASGNDVRGRFRTVNNVGVQLVGNVSLLDGGGGAATSKASLVRLQQAEQARDAARVDLATTFSRLQAQLDGRKARSDGFEQAYQQAVSLAARMREQFRAGRRPRVDLLAQETEIYQTKLSTLGEYYDSLLAQARLAHNAGQLLAALKIDAPAVVER